MSDAPPPREIVATREGCAGIVRFDRPQSLNALSDTMLRQTREAMEGWLREVDVAAVILTGSERSFSSGGDMKASAEAAMPPYEKYLHRFVGSEWHNFSRFLQRYPRPVIAAVEGHCLGGGLELALVADFIIAGRTADFGLTEARHGLFPILGGAWSLARAVGERRAKELTFTGRRFDAHAALAMGLVNEVTEPGGAVARAVEIADEIGSCAPLSVAAAKQAIDRAARQSFDEGLTAAGEFSAMLMFSEDRREGLAAFKEKRRPSFKGR